jgi:hypothetical protein
MADVLQVRQPPIRHSIDWAQSHLPVGITISDYYRGSVIGGLNAFVMPVVGFDTFGYAAKLRNAVS